MPALINRAQFGIEISPFLCWFKWSLGQEQLLLLGKFRLRVYVLSKAWFHCIGLEQSLRTEVCVGKGILYIRYYKSDFGVKIVSGVSSVINVNLGQGWRVQSHWACKAQYFHPKRDSNSVCIPERLTARPNRLAGSTYRQELLIYSDSHVCNQPWQHQYLVIIDIWHSLRDVVTGTKSLT